MATQLKLDFRPEPDPAMLLGMIDQIELCCHTVGENARVELELLWERIGRHLVLPREVRFYVAISMEALGLNHRGRVKATKAIIQAFLADAAPEANTLRTPKKPPQSASDAGSVTGRATLRSAPPARQAERVPRRNRG